MTMLKLSPSTTFRGRMPDFAGTPAEYRGAERRDVRLAVARDGSIRHRHFSDLVDELSAVVALVVNTSATVNAEIDAILLSVGGPREVVVHVAVQLAKNQWVIELRSAPDAADPVLDAHPGDRVQVTAGVGLQLIGAHPEPGGPGESGNRLWRAFATGRLRRALNRQGRPIAYGYLDGRWPLSAYQTIFSRHPGSAEMASAGRPFTSELAHELAGRAVAFAPVLLHTGVSSQEAGEPPQSEWFEVSERTAAMLNDVRDTGGRIIAVGTTATRAVESAVRDGRVWAGQGWTDRVITPDAPPQVVEGLITGWHDAGASHLMLVEAVAGAALTQAAYDAALTEGYVWHEFGDSALFLPNR